MLLHRINFIERRDLKIDHMEFRQTLGHFATGITVVTTVDRNNEMVGLTGQLIVDHCYYEPPLILVLY